MVLLVSLVVVGLEDPNYRATYTVTNQLLADSLNVESRRQRRPFTFCDLGSRIGRLAAVEIEKHESNANTTLSP